MPKTIPIIKQSGVIRNKDYALRQLDMLFGTISDGEYELILPKKKKKRTIPQNRLMWLWFACLEQDSGTPKESFHDYYCGMFLLRHETVMGKDVTLVSGTSKLNTVQFKDFLDKVQADVASERGIILPNPDDLYWSEFEAYYENFI
jgi:hypothetical protein